MADFMTPEETKDLDASIAAAFGGAVQERAEAVAQAQGKAPYVLSVNISESKGERKTPVDDGVEVLVEEQFGLSGDAHAGDWHRQVSLLANESIQRAQAAGQALSIHFSVPNSFAGTSTSGSGFPSRSNPAIRYCRVVSPFSKTVSSEAIYGVQLHRGT